MTEALKDNIKIWSLNDGKNRGIIISVSKKRIWVDLVHKDKEGDRAPAEFSGIILMLRYTCNYS